MATQCLPSIPRGHLPMTSCRSLPTLQTVRNALSAKSDRVASRALDGFAQIGAIVPTTIALEGIQPLPADLVQQIPSLASTAYVISENKVLLVNPRTRVVVAVIE